jgi:hypothetical protein
MATTTRKPYPTDLTDEQWAILQPLLPPAKPGGRPRAVDLREVINTLLYLNRMAYGQNIRPHRFTRGDNPIMAPSSDGILPLKHRYSPWVWMEDGEGRDTWIGSSC